MVKLRFIGVMPVRLLELSRINSFVVVSKHILIQGQIKVKNQIINYQVKNSSRAKNIRLAVYSNGSVIVTRPVGVPLFLVNGFIKQKVDWLFTKVNAFSNLKFTIPKSDKKDYLKNKARALELVKQKITELNKVYNFRFNRIGVRNQKTRWGSCSAKGNLNFNYRIIYLSDQLARYIVAHELCHLKELNHSGKFWQLVSIAVPDYLSVREKLKNII